MSDVSVIGLGNMGSALARAIEIDPKYGKAFAGLANCAAILRSHHGSGISVDDIMAITNRALAINPDQAEVYAVRGRAFAVDDRRMEAFSAFERALALNPNCFEAQYYYGSFLTNIGDYAKAVDHFARATEIRPEDCGPPYSAAQALRLHKQHQASVTYSHIAIKRATETLRRHPENSMTAQLLALALAFTGDSAQARFWLARAMEIDPGDNALRYNAACTYAMLGDSMLAIDLLETSIPQMGRDMQLWFQNDPDFAAIRSHPRYQTLLDMVK